MPLDVLLERAELGEASPAVRAHVAALGVVRLPVASQVALAGEGLGAEVALVRPEARVALHVGAQVAAALEGLAAVRARLWRARGRRAAGGGTRAGPEAARGNRRDESWELEGVHL